MLDIFFADCRSAILAYEKKALPSSSLLRLEIQDGDLIHERLLIKYSAIQAI